MRCEFLFLFLPKLRARKLACRGGFLGKFVPGEKFTFEVETHREKQRELCKWRAAGLIALMQLRFLNEAGRIGGRRYKKKIFFLLRETWWIYARRKLLLIFLFSSGTRSLRSQDRRLTCRRNRRRQADIKWKLLTGRDSMQFSDIRFWSSWKWTNENGLNRCLLGIERSEVYHMDENGWPLFRFEYKIGLI